MNQYRTVNKVLAGISFLLALITYMLTLQPSVPFWDCGEFSAAAMWQQVPHPPGAPLWLIVGKVFEVFLPGDPGWAFNFFAAVCSAFAVMFTYLVVVNLAERFKPYMAGRPASAYISTYGAGLVGALAFAWSDTNWFNSVESEVYSAATFLTAAMIWMMTKWDQQAERPGHERWIFLMAYVAGLAIGVHLLALLVLPAVAFTIYLRRFEFRAGPSVLAAGVSLLVLGTLYLQTKGMETVPRGLILALAFAGLTFGAYRAYKNGTVWGAFLLMFLITIGGFVLIYQGTLSWIPQIMSATMIGGILLLAALVGLAVWAHRNGKTYVFMAATSFLLVILGYTSYTQILVRSAAHPPMNENEPDTFAELASYLGREQYGDRDHWPRRVDHLFRPEFEESLGKYGPLPQGEQGPNGEIIWSNVDMGAEIGYMISYQMYEMYFRYLFWNFVGRASDVQGAETTLMGVSTADADNIRSTGEGEHFPITFFALPLILGLFGIFYHYQRDWKMALVFTILFLLLGVLTALQQRQQDPQPRERDYFYAASFMIYTMWIGLGAMGIAELIGRRRREARSEERQDELYSVGTGSVGLSAAAILVCLIAVPVNMLANGWTLHDRSRNWLPWDYAYNMLQSVEPNAILFTNGDNDTFPVWYLQDVAGVRRDVRVVNLELAQTRWYHWQMKKERPWGADTVPIGFSDEFLRLPENHPEGLRASLGAPREIRLSVPAKVMGWATGDSVTSAGTMTWTYRGEQDRGEGQTIFMPKNEIVRDIVEQNAKNGWTRPLYFSVTAGPQVFSGLDQFLRQEGLALRIMPVPQISPSGGPSYNKTVMNKSLLEPLPADEWSPTHRYGFKFRGLNDENAYFLGQDDHRRPQNIFYRPLYLQYASYLIEDGDQATAVKVLDKMNELIPPQRFGAPYYFADYYGFFSQVADLYYAAGAPEKAKQFAQMALENLEDVEKSGRMPQPRSIYDNPTYVRAKAAAALGNYEQAIKDFEMIVQSAPDQPILRLDLDRIRVRQYLDKKDTAKALQALTQILSEHGASGDPMRMSISYRLRQEFGRLLGNDTGFTAPDNTRTAEDTIAAN